MVPWNTNKQLFLLFKEEWFIGTPVRNLRMTMNGLKQHSKPSDDEEESS